MNDSISFSVKSAHFSDTQGMTLLPNCCLNCNSVDCTAVTPTEVLGRAGEVDFRADCLNCQLRPLLWWVKVHFFNTTCFAALLAN